MPRKPTLSPSKITTYLACPAKYKWTYVDERGRWYLRSKSYYSFGTTLHRVLQRFHDAGDAGVTTAHEATAALEESWIDAGYSSQDEMTQAMAEGRMIVAEYVEKVLREPITSKTLFIEKTVRLDLGDFVLLGRVDRVDECEDGCLEIIDYKSGRRGVTDEEVANDLAMSVYQILLKGQYPEKSVKATIIALRAGAKASASLSEADAAALTEDLKILGREILHRDYESLVPIGKLMCHGCDFLQLCLRHPEFELPPLPVQEPEM